ncbi:MFS transporter [Saccharopolyspora sp. NPDC047091]|uniref:MFS transporter n=1 Tax=Saccharopolyspora sp. NPDC047091 TaxID=3155924 RepID=UPI0033FD4EA7
MNYAGRSQRLGEVDPLRRAIPRTDSPGLASELRSARWRMKAAESPVPEEVDGAHRRIRNSPGGLRTARHVRRRTMSGPGQEPPAGRPSTGAVIAGFTLIVALGVAVASLGASLPFLREHYGIGVAASGFAVVAFNVGALLSTLVCGLADRRLPPKPTVFVLLALFATGLGSAGAAPTWTLFVTAITVAGLGYGGLALYLNTAFASAFGRHNVLMINLLQAAFGIGAIIGPIATAATAPVDVRWTLTAMAVVTVLCWTAAGCCAAERRVPAAEGAGWSSLRMVLVVSAPFIIAGIFYNGLETSVGAWASTHLTWSGMDPGDAARSTALFWAGLTAGRVIIPLAAKNLGPATLIRISLAIAVAVFSLSAWGAAPVLCYAVAGFALGPVLPTTLAWLSTATHRAQLANSILLTGCMAANVTHPWLVGITADPAKPWTIPAVLTGFAALGLVAALSTTVFRPKTAADDKVDQHATTTRS